MSPRRLLRRYEPASDAAFVSFAERLFERLASIAVLLWPEREQEAARLSRLERALRRRFPWASVEIAPDGASVVVSRDGGHSQSAW